MFETRRRSHPLQTFRFWFVVLGAALVTMAWRFDLLPFRIGPANTGEMAAETFVDVDQFVADEESSMADVELPFTDRDQTPPVPTLSEALPDAPMQTEPAPQQTAAIEPASELHVTRTDVNDRLAEHSGEVIHHGRLFADETAGQSSPPASDSFLDDDWPTAQESPRAMDVAPEQPTASASAIIQTGATAAAFEATPGNGVTTADATIGADVLPATPAPNGPLVDFTKIDRLLDRGTAADEIEAHRMLSTLYWEQPESRDQLRERIDKLAQRIYFLKSRHYMDAYQVQPGDMLQLIARQYDVPWQYLAKLNRVDPKRVRDGQRLKVIKGPFSAIVDLSDYELTIHAHGYFVTRYPVGIGKDGASPVGKFEVQEKLVDPTYYGPNGVIAHDDPANPLGERWIDIGDSYGIHGTIDPTSIGKSESQGCIRLHNDHAEAVYDLLSIGSEVTIRP